MNSDRRQHLEREIDRALKGLPELNAPNTLAPRVMAAIGRAGARPWYRQPWPAWPIGWRVASLGIMLAMFAGLGVAGWQWSHTRNAAGIGQAFSHCFSALNLVWETGCALANAAVLAAKSLGTGFVIAGVAATAIAYAACIGLGTVVVRLAMVRRHED